MPLLFTATCGVCGHRWEVNLDQHTPLREIYRSLDAGVRVEVEEYRFQCPLDGEFTIEEVEIEAGTGGTS